MYRKADAFSVGRASASPGTHASVDVLKRMGSRARRPVATRSVASFFAAQGYGALPEPGSCLVAYARAV